MGQSCLDPALLAPCLVLGIVPRRGRYSSLPLVRVQCLAKGGTCFPWRHPGGKREIGYHAMCGIARKATGGYEEFPHRFCRERRIGLGTSGRRRFLERMAACSSPMTAAGALGTSRTKAHEGGTDMESARGVAKKPRSGSLTITRRLPDE